MRVLVMLPTYNEIENIQDVLERARAALPDADILVIDDGSPDGTADQAEKLGEVLGGIDVLRRADEVGPRVRVPRRVPGRARARLRRHDRDGRRPLARPRGAARARRRGRARRRPRHRVALRARRIDPRLEVAPARHLPWWRALRAHHARPLGARRHRRLPCVPPRQPVPDRPRPGPGRRLRLPGRDDLPHRAQRRPHRRGADRVPRPQPRPVEDVEPHRGRGVPAGHVVGSPGPVHAGTTPTGPPRGDTDGMALSEFTVAGALVESPDGLLLVRNQRRNGATDWSTPGRRDRRHRRVARAPASPARSRRRPASGSPTGKARSTRCGPPRSRWAG